MLYETLKHLRNTCNWRITQIKYKINLMDYYIKHHQPKKALKTMQEIQKNLNTLQEIADKLIHDINTQLETKRRQLCQQP